MIEQTNDSDADQTPQKTDAPPGTDSRFVSILKYVGWLLLGVLGPVTPWFQPLFAFGLVSEYFYPTVNPVASLFAVLAFAICHLRYKNYGKARLHGLLWNPFGLAFGISFFGCLALSLTIGEIWEPPVWFAIPLRIAWILLYLIVFVSLSCLLSVLGLLFVGRKQP